MDWLHYGVAFLVGAVVFALTLTFLRRRRKP